MPVSKPTDSRFVDLEGTRVVRLLITGYDGQRPVGGGWISDHCWRCRCDCGKEVVVRGTYLKNALNGINGTRSCGCMGREKNAARMATQSRRHGYFGTPEYDSWNKMRGRCKEGGQYFDQGIRVCSRYDKFEDFIADLGDRPTPDHGIDRPDKWGHYSCGRCDECRANDWPTNIRWATRSQRQRTRRHVKILEYDGLSLRLPDWADRVGIPAQTIQQRLSRGWSVGNALGCPLGSLNPDRETLPPDEVRKRYLARQFVHSAVQSGKLIRPDVCPKCGKSDYRIEGHHHNGYEPEHVLDVVWYCLKCHKEIERAESADGTEA
jgi:hypothetical protein